MTGAGVRYFGATVDNPDTTAHFAAALGLEFPILSDSTKAVARDYGVLAPTGYPRRWTFYIGVDGGILAIDRQVTPVSHGSDIVARLRELRAPGFVT